MAKVIITESYLEDIADAIRTKTGTSDTYNPSEMAPAILSISGGGGITPTGTISITSNGTYNVTSYASAEVAVPTGSTINNQNKSVTPTEQSQSITYDSGYTGLGTVTVEAISSTYVGSGITVNPTPTASGATVTIPTGYYSSQTTKSVSTTTHPKPTISVNSTTGVITASHAQTAGYVSAGTTTETSNLTTQAATTITPTTSAQTAVTAGKYTIGAVTVAAIPSQYIIPTGNKSITENGTGIDVAQYATVSVNVSGGTINNQNKSVDPTESEQSVTYDSGYTGLGTVTVGAISITYVGSGITRRSSTDLSASGATVTVPAGYYSAQATKSVSSMTLPTAASASATSGYTSKATISRSTSDQYINIPTGYNSAGAYYKISAVANGSVTAPSTISGTSATLSTGTGTLTLTKTVSVTPNVTTAGYISSGTAGDSSVSLTASVTIDPTPTASGATVTIPAGYYSSQTTKSVTTMTLPTSASASATSGYTSKATISRSTSDQYINIAPGYNNAGGYYKISAVANGSATGPSSLSGSSASVSTGTNTLTLTKTDVTTTPTVSAGYVASATASTATVTLTASVTTKAATTYNTSSTDQTISSGTYLTGTQTIKAVTVSGLSADKILSGTTVKIGDANDDDRIASVSGSVTLTTVYTGSSAPSSSLGSNNDIYIQN